MRPVEKGPAPKVYADYSEALGDLIAAVGDFCSYCERQIETHLAVEHIQPKSRRKALRNEWSNFLLACVNCNSCKGKKHVDLDRHVWPDRDNTMRAFVYAPDGTVHVNPRLRAANRSLANATLILVGLDRVPGNSDRRKRPSKADLRWRRRQEAWDLAVRERQRLRANDSVVVRELIADVAHGRGMFAIWMQVFATDPDMRARLVARFSGTARRCFDATSHALRKRRGGRL